MVFYSQELSFDLDQAYYAGVAFITLMVLGWLVTKLIGVILRDLRFRNSLFEYDWVVAGVLNVIIVYTFIFLVLFLLTTIPFDAIQQLFEKRGSMRFIIEKSPFLSKPFYQLWITDIIR
jgi:sensor histidine kinase YesM